MVKTGGRRLHQALTIKQVESVDTPGRYWDGNGLFLVVQPSGSRQWKQRVTINGRRREIGLGGFPRISLKMAREAALDNFRKAYAGVDPLVERRRRQSVPTFREAGQSVWELNRGSWRGGAKGKTSIQWIQTMEKHVFPLIGTLRINAITTEDLLNVLNPIWSQQPRTAADVKRQLGQVLTWAVARRFRSDNPADVLPAVLPRQKGRARPMPSIPYHEVPEVVRGIRAADTHGSLKLALELVILTATRSGEVRLAVWEEFDLGNRIWTIPPERMKMGRGHRIPLADRAVEVLNTARREARGAVVFPGHHTASILKWNLLRFLQEIYPGATVHGFRSSFRVWTQEQTDFPKEVCEAALAHQNKTQVEAAYARSDLFDRRRELMDLWAQFAAS